MAKFKKNELEASNLTRLERLCFQEGLSYEGDRDTLIARLLGKEKPEPKPEPEPEPEAPEPEA